MQSEEGTHSASQVVPGGVTIVMCRGRLDLVQGTLGSIENQTVQPMWTLLIDTGVDKNTTQWLRKVKLSSASLSVDDCVGVESVATCWNRALEWAFLGKERAEALVVDSHVELLPETYEVLAEKLRKHGLGIVSAIRVERRKELVSRDGTQYELSTTRLDFNCFMISRDAWDKAGPFDEGRRGQEGDDMDCRMKSRGMITATVDVPFLRVTGKLFQTKGEKGRKGGREGEGEDDEDGDGGGGGSGLPFKPIRVY